MYIRKATTDQLNETNAQALIQALAGLGIDTSRLTQLMSQPAAAANVPTAIANSLHDFLFAAPTATKARRGEVTIAELMAGVRDSLHRAGRYS